MSGHREEGPMIYSVYAIIYRNESLQFECVAVSGSNERAAIKRLHGNRNAEVISCWPILGRKPEYHQDRIEGTCDLRDLGAAAPPAGTPEAEVIREFNHLLIEKLGGNTGLAMGPTKAEALHRALT